MEWDTPTSLGLKDVVSNPIHVSNVQHHGSVLNLDIRPLVRNGFEDIVANVFSVEKSTNMSIKLGLMIEFKGDLDSINLKEN